jgi:hypothetical protein
MAVILQRNKLPEPEQDSIHRIRTLWPIKKKTREFHNWLAAIIGKVFPPAPPACGFAKE